jgi:hypothetical protein
LPARRGIDAAAPVWTGFAGSVNGLFMRGAFALPRASVIF